MTDRLSEKSQGKARLWVGMIVVTGVLLAAGFVFIQKYTAELEVTPLAPLQVVRIGLAMQPTNALNMIALVNGYFQQEGLKPVVKEYPSGKRAIIDGLYTGEVDIAASADVPVAIAGLEGREVKILATSFNADNVNAVVGRRDRGIKKPEDLRDKRLATQRNSAVHFFLHLFLQKHGLTEEDVQLSYMKAEQLPIALARGDIDAFSMREPYISQAQELLVDNAVVFSEPGLYKQEQLILMRTSLQKSTPDIAHRYLLALLKAEAFAASQPQEAIRITAERLGVEQHRIAKMWPTFKLRIALDQATLLLLESEARWAIKDGLVHTSEVPNYVDMMAPEFLKSIKPTAVSVTW